MNLFILLLVLVLMLLLLRTGWYQNKWILLLLTPQISVILDLLTK